MNYWDKQWEKRIHSDGSVSGNSQKVRFLIEQLWMRPHLIKAEKLDVGCGPATHIRHLTDVCSEWGDKYIGIDTSKKAIEDAQRHGVNAFRYSIYDFTNYDRDIEAFFFFDVLEHMEDHDKIAEKIKEIAAENYTILINVPLYKSNPESNGGYERLININDMVEFLSKAGISKYTHKVYGINGLPYLFMEGVTG